MQWLLLFVHLSRILKMGERILHPNNSRLCNATVDKSRFKNYNLQNDYIIIS